MTSGVNVTEHARRVMTARDRTEGGERVIPFRAAIRLLCVIAPPVNQSGRGDDTNTSEMF